MPPPSPQQDQHNSDIATIQAALQRLNDAMVRVDDKLILLTTTGATRTDLKELRDEIMRGFVQRDLYEQQIANLKEDLKDLKQELDSEKKMSAGMIERAITRLGAVVAILLGIIQIIQHVKLF